MTFYLRPEKRMDMVLQMMHNGLVFVRCKMLEVEGGRRVHSRKFGKRTSLRFKLPK